MRSSAFWQSAPAQRPATMPEYKLHYFNLRGRAEIARLILHQAGVAFEDIRYDRINDWPAIKSKMPFGQVPVLEVDGKMLAQSHTIGRYLARKHGLAGKDAWEEAQADMYADCITDLMSGMKPGFLEKDPEKQKEMYQKFMLEAVIPHVAIVNSHLEKNGTGFLVGSEVTWADLAYYGFLSFLMEKFGEDYLKDASNVKALIDRVGELPNIKAWVESRPKTEI